MNGWIGEQANHCRLDALPTCLWTAWQRRSPCLFPIPSAPTHQAPQGRNFMYLGPVSSQFIPTPCPPVSAYLSPPLRTHETKPSTCLCSSKCLDSAAALLPKACRMRPLKQASESNSHKQSHTGTGTSCSYSPRFSPPCCCTSSHEALWRQVCNLCILYPGKNVLFYFCPTTS